MYLYITSLLLVCPFRFQTKVLDIKHNFEYLINYVLYYRATNMVYL